MVIKKHIDKFLESPVKLFVFFIIVNLMPSFGLLFTEPFDIWGKIVLILFPLGIYFILFSAFRNIGLIQLILIPLLIIHAFQIVVFYLFGEGVIAVDMFLNVVTTNVSEAGEVLQGILASVIFVIVIYVPTIVVAVLAYRKKTHFTGKLRRRNIIAGVVLIAVSYALSLAALNKNTGRFSLHNDVYPADVSYNLNFARAKWSRSNKYQQTSQEFTFDAVRKDSAAKREIYVLVIGETSRADSWGLYGYEVNTTPKLQQDTNIVVMRDALTQSNTTHKSVSIMLTPASAENYDCIYNQKSILETFREVGFTTVFISNQSANHTFTDYFAQQADHSKYFRFFNERTNNYDKVLLPQLQHYIDSLSGNLFVVLHTYGSHFNYRERYPEEFAVFQPDRFTEVSRASRDMVVNAYNNTILYTDSFLHDLIGILHDSKSCSAFFYTSDHGEDILDDDRQRFLHASPSPTYYQLRVPMLMWFSPEYRQSFPRMMQNAEDNRSKPVTTNTTFHTLLDMANIETVYKNPEKSLVNQQLKVTERMYLNDHDKPIPFYNSGLKKEDKAMIRKNNIAH